jgi:hypothetical protein
LSISQHRDLAERSLIDFFEMASSNHSPLSRLGTASPTPAKESSASPQGDAADLRRQHALMSRRRFPTATPAHHSPPTALTGASPHRMSPRISPQVTILDPWDAVVMPAELTRGRSSSARVTTTSQPNVEATIHSAPVRKAGYSARPSLIASQVIAEEVDGVDAEEDGGTSRSIGAGKNTRFSIATSTLRSRPSLMDQSTDLDVEPAGSLLSSPGARKIPPPPPPPSRVSQPQAPPRPPIRASPPSPPSERGGQPVVTPIASPASPAAAARSSKALPADFVLVLVSLRTGHSS